MVHELQEGGESESQHLAEAEKKNHILLVGPLSKTVIAMPHKLYLNLLGSALDQARQGADALHVDELSSEGWVCGQLGELLQSFQPSVDAVGLDPLQELASGSALPAVKNDIDCKKKKKNNPIEEAGLF